VSVNSRNLEKNDIYINRWMTGLNTNRSPLFSPLSSQGLQVISRYDTLWDGLNTDISHQMTLVRRYGFTRYCSTAVSGSEYPLNFYSFKNTSGTVRAMLDTNTNVSYFDGSSITSLYSKGTTQQTAFVKVGDTLYTCDGTNANKWNGVTVTKWGIVAPTAAPTFTLGTGSLTTVNGGYTYVFSYKNSTSGHVSTSSPVSASTGNFTSKHIVLQGTSSSDTQVDKIDIFRTADGGANYYYLATVNNGGTWTYTDNTADTGLNTFIVAPIDGSNNPPPAGIGVSCFHMGRLWVGSGNFLYFGGGSDITYGVPEESFPPANVFTLPGKVVAMASTSSGLVVWTQADAYVVTGITTSSFVCQIWQTNLGVYGQNSVCQDGDLFYLFTTQGQLFQFSSALAEIGFTIQENLEAFNPANVYLTLHRSGIDEGLFISDGSTNFYRYSISMNCWSPVAQPVAGVKCMKSIEVSPATYKLMMGRATVGGYILARDTNTYSDDGTAYPASATIGSLTLAPPRQHAVVNSVLLNTMPVGTFPTVSVLVNEISGTFTQIGVTPNGLSAAVADPWELPASTTVKSMRLDLTAAKHPIPNRVLNMQIKLDFPSEAAKNEVLTLAVA
jgi:hypothetical protein